MSTKLMNPDERSKRTESQDEKSGPTSESSLPQEQSVQQKPLDGKPGTPAKAVMTQEEVSDLLARLQDVLSLWDGSDNKIIGNFVMTAFPIPAGMKVEKVMTATGKAFTVDGVPVVNTERS
jgi:hypothetical protein